MMKRLLKVGTLIFAAALGVAAQAADLATEAMQAAYAPYRAALFRTNSNSQPEARQAIAQAQSAWKLVTGRFAGAPPAPYDRDALFGATLAKVSSVYDKAEKQIGAGELSAAHETLEEVRDLLAELRQRNGVVVFSDHMNAYHAEMEYALIEGPKILAAAHGIALLTAQAGVLEYLVRQLRAQAPAASRENAEFLSLLADVEGSVQALKKAAVSQDVAAVRGAIAKLKAPYSKLFLKFG
jgi:hypothetical protein